MERRAGFANLEDFLQSKEDLKQKLIILKRSSNPFIKKLTPPERIKFWLALIPEALAEKVRSFYRLVKVKNSVKVLTKHKMIVDYDTLYLAKQINESDKDDFLIITNAKLSMMRSIICLYLAFTKDIDYHRGWSHISYALLSLGAGEEETLLIFTHLVQNVITNYYKVTENYSVRSKISTEFYLLAERQRYSFCNLSHNSIFKSNVKDDTDIFEYSDPRTKLTLFHNQNLKNFGLFILLKTLCDEWFGSLFSNILFPKDCLAFWDNLLISNYRLLYKFGLTILAKSNSKIEQILKKEKKSLTELGIETPQHHLLLLAHIIKKQLTNVLPSNEYNSIMTSALDRRDSVLVLPSDKKTSTLLQEIPHSLPIERVNNLTELKKELGAASPLDVGRILSICGNIDDQKGEKFNIKEFMSLVQSNQITYPSLAVKIFVLLDTSLRGYVTKRDLKIFFTLLTDNLDRKIKLFWKDITKDKNLISAEETLDLLQTLDYFFNPDSTVVSESMSALYERLLYGIPDLNISVDNLLQLIKYNKNCIQILKPLQVIEGKEENDGVIHTESEYDEAEIEEKTDNDFRFDKTSRSQRLSGVPTNQEISSLKGRGSYSRKSGFLDVDNVRSGLGNLKEESSMTDELGRSRMQSEAQTPYDKVDSPKVASVTNTDENFADNQIQPPTFQVRSPIMTPKNSKSFLEISQLKK